MTTVLRGGRLRIATYREGRSQHHLPHCHVYLLGAEAVFALMSLECLANDGFRTKSLKQIQEIIADHKDDFLEIWRLLNGEEN